jgi:hypothetical protein
MEDRYETTGPRTTRLAMADFMGGGHTNTTFKSNTEFVQKLKDMLKI